MKASNKDSALAQNNLCVIFLREGDLLNAKHWFTVAAKQANAKSMFNLALINKFECNLHEAKLWYEKAYSQDIVQAKTFLNELHNYRYSYSHLYN